MGRIAPEDIKQMAEESEKDQGLKVSIYLPTHRQGAPDLVSADRTRLKNLLQRAKEERSNLPEATLAAGLQLYDDLDFWRNQQQALAVFINSQGKLKYYKLPVEVEEHVTVASDYYLTPLLALLEEDRSFYLLSLNRTHPRIYLADRFGIEELPDTMPESLDEALRIDERETQSQFHSGGGAGRYGHGGNKDDIQSDLRRYLRMIDDAAIKVARKDTHPLLLAGTTEMIGHFRELSRYRPIITDQINGNWEHAPADKLHALAWPLIERGFAERRRQLRERVAQLAQTAPNLLATHISQIVEAAKAGRVDTLLVRMSHRTRDSVRGQLERVRLLAPQPGNLGRLSNLVAIQSWLSRGQVIAVSDTDLPASEPVVAILRY